MSFSEFILQLNPAVTIIISIMIFVVILILTSKGVELSSKGKTIHLFSRKKNNALQSALVLEKIIEIAYEISFYKKEKKIRKQMSYCETMFDELTTVYEKEFRSSLEDKLKEQEVRIINLEDHPDLELYKICLQLITLSWKNYSRTFFNELFEKIESLSSTDFEKEKDVFVFTLMKEKEDVLNNMYKDNVECYTRTLNRSEVYYLMKEGELKITHSLKEIINHAKNLNDRIKIEEFNKRKELEEFLKENVI